MLSNTQWCIQSIFLCIIKAPASVFRLHNLFLDDLDMCALTVTLLHFFPCREAWKNLFSIPCTSGSLSCECWSFRSDKFLSLLLSHIHCIILILQYSSDLQPELQLLYLLLWVLANLIFIQMTETFIWIYSKYWDPPLSPLTISHPSLKLGFCNIKCHQLQNVEDTRQ